MVCLICTDDGVFYEGWMEITVLEETLTRETSRKVSNDDKMGIVG